MSFQPPPQPHQPPGRPQPPQQPIGFGAPTSGGQPPASGSSGRAHKPRMVAPAMIVAALVLIAVAVGVVVLAGGGGSGKIDAEGAADGLDAVIDDAEFENGYADIRRCPFGDQQDLAEKVLDTLALDDDVLDGASQQFAIESSDPFPTGIWCSQSAGELDELDGAPTVGFSASELPRGDYAEAIEEQLAESTDIEVDDPVDHKGGAIYAYCNQPANGSYGCGADWVDEENDINIGLSYSSDDADGEAAVDALKELLPDLVKALAEEG